MKKVIIPIYKLNKGIVFGTLLLTYAIVFFILARTVGYKNMTNGELIGCYVNAGIVAAIALA
jgi:hypothetical protein